MIRALLVCAAVAAATALVVGGRASDARPPSAAAAAASLPTAPRPAFQVGAPIPLSGRATTWAAVRRDAIARRRPSPSAPAVGLLPARTPEGTTDVVLPLAHHGLWVRVRLPILPNGASGWVPRSALGAYGSVRTRLVVDLSALRATLLRDGRAVLRVPVGVGTAAAPTPPGDFVIRDRLTRYRSAFYGPVALGTSARSPAETDWPGGGFVGIHGTDRPDLIPGRVSHGCIRLRNADVVKLARLAPVGTPVTIRA